MWNLYIYIYRKNVMECRLVKWAKLQCCFRDCDLDSERQKGVKETVWGRLQKIEWERLEWGEGHDFRQWETKWERVRKGERDEWEEGVGLRRWETVIESELNEKAGGRLERWCKSLSPLRQILFTPSAVLGPGGETHSLWRQHKDRFSRGGWTASPLLRPKSFGPGVCRT